MKILNENIKQELTKKVNQAETSFMIVTPYLQEEVCNELLEMTKGLEIDLRLVTAAPNLDYLTGMTEIKVLKQLEHAGFTVKLLENLEASLILLDEQSLYVGGVNGLASSERQECLICCESGAKEADLINQLFWESDQVEDFSDYKGIESGLERLKSENIDILDQLEKINEEIAKLTPEASDDSNKTDPSLFECLKIKGIIDAYETIESNDAENLYKIDHKQTVKVISSEHDEFSNGFLFCLSENDADLFRKREVDAIVVLIDGEEKFISLPTVFVTKHLVKRSYKGENGWEFIIKQIEDESYITVKGKRNQTEIDIKQYGNGLNFRMKGKKV